MKPMQVGIFSLALLLAGPALAADGTPLRSANGVLVDANGKTVYTFDKDEAGGGRSACSGTCAKNWPPVNAAGMRLNPPYSSITREDGSKQLVHRGKPLYTFIKDQKEGDKTGDGVGGVWHVVTEAGKE
ncbi:hypothetical protein B0920_15260 [Massilia sp. KIM]|uniref:COG4315 family predicted lipoprotein n=1 Tax=Massilia sp. KIM TaxID=1955422 RepID=UPI0009D3FBEC|nr:hypothetical protein [Massilia sp. KIM]OON60350.1 hypothetical protein B0920_15260 [Massilia sp. KIM]